MGGLRDAGEAGGWRTVHTIQEVWPRASAAGVGHTCRAKNRPALDSCRQEPDLDGAHQLQVRPCEDG